MDSTFGARLDDIVIALIIRKRLKLLTVTIVITLAIVITITYDLGLLFTGTSLEPCF